MGAEKVAYVVESRTLMTGEYITDARVRPSLAIARTLRRVIPTPPARGFSSRSPGPTSNGVWPSCSTIAFIQRR